MSAIGFSGHAPVPFENKFAISDHESLRRYCTDIMGLKDKYREKINVFLALEADYIEGVTTDFSDFIKTFKLDYIIGSVHLVKNVDGHFWFIDGPDSEIWKKGLTEDFGGDIRKAVRAYYHQLNEMVETQKPDVVGHLDKIKMHNRGEYFREDEKWYTDLVTESLECIKFEGSIVEVNTRGLYKKRSDDFFPGEKILAEMLQLNIPVTISSDAHKPKEVSLLLEHASEVLYKIGYREIYVFTNEGWKGIPII